MEQLCLLCNKLFDLEKGGFKIVRGPERGKTFVVEQVTGAAHDLLSEKRTQRRLRERQKRIELSVIVRFLNLVEENSPAATPHTPVETNTSTPEPSKEPEPVAVMPEVEPYHAEEPFVPQAEDWWNVLIVSVCSRGFARGIIGGERKGTPVFVHMKNVRMASGSDKPENLKAGQWLACQIVPSEREDSAFLFEAQDAVIEDSEEEQS